MLPRRRNCRWPRRALALQLQHRSGYRSARLLDRTRHRQQSNFHPPGLGRQRRSIHRGSRHRSRSPPRRWSLPHRHRCRRWLRHWHCRRRWRIGCRAGTLLGRHARRPCQNEEGGARGDNEAAIAQSHYFSPNSVSCNHVDLARARRTSTTLTETKLGTLGRATASSNATMVPRQKLGYQSRVTGKILHSNRWLSTSRGVYEQQDARQR